MKKRLLKIALLLILISAVFPTMVSCVGPDVMPDYFGFYAKDDDKEPEATESTEPSEEAPVSVEIFKLVVGDDGRQKEVPIPSGRILEIGSGTFVAQDETDIGPKYNSSAKFKIENGSDEPIGISLPSQLGSFFISSNGSLEQTLSPKQSMIVTITFSPAANMVGDGGKVSEEFEIEGNAFELTGVALKPSGFTTANVVDNSGNVIMSNATHVIFDEIPLSTHPIRRFFRCEQISCNGDLRLASCVPCIDMLGGSCELLSINKDGKPVDEVNESCQPAHEDTLPVYEMNLSSTDIMTTKVQKKIIEIQNTGPEQLIINSLNIIDVDSSESKKQFSINKKAIFVADSFGEIKNRILTAFDAGSSAPSVKFPIVLPPYDSPVMTTRLYMVVSYHPNDVVGADGREAAVGSSTKDEAILRIEHDDGSKDIYLTGATSVKEIPALQVYVKSSSGLRPITNGDTLPFKGITIDTTNLAIPLFMKLSDSAAKTLRISSVNMEGSNFEWLDTKDKINSKPEDVRCSIPVFDDSGSQIDIISDLNPVSLNPNGYALIPGTATIENMPLFGCINFVRAADALETETTFEAQMTITAQELTSAGTPAVNPDGKIKETTFSFRLLGVIDPLKGQVVLRLTQTMAMILNPQFPAISAVASKDEMDIIIASGEATEQDRDLFITAMHLDPFDEENIYNVDGTLASTPGDGITAVFQSIDTRAVPVTYDDPTLSNYTSLIHDSTLPAGQQGIFEGYPNLPEIYRTPGMKIFTATLSYPGPLAPVEERPNESSECEVIDPCTADGLRKLGEGTSNPSYKGVCAYFYNTAGSYDSPAFHYPTEEPPGNRRDMCKDRDKKYDLKPIVGKYFLDGRMEFENAGLLFQGPTYFHTPYGPLGSDAGPLDELFHVTFTTEPILPQSDTKIVDRIPDKRIDVAKGEYRINLNDPYSDLPQLCPNNTKNRYLQGEYYSTWKYLAPLLKKDKEGKISAGCPEEDNNFTGGIAYLSGKRLDQKTGHASWITAAKFSSAKNLTFAFKDVMFFMVLNGWFCDPLGPEEEMEGKHCFDKEFNYRDAQTQYSIVKK